MKKNYLFILLGILIICACSKSKENQYSDFDKRIQSDYSKESHNIVFKRLCFNDVESKIVPYSREDLRCTIYFFNYGNEISLCKYVIDDYVTNGIGRIICIERIREEEQIRIKNTSNNDKYGEYANVIFSDNLNNFDNVFMTPLAYHAYQNKNIDELVFFRLENNCPVLILVDSFVC